MNSRGPLEAIRGDLEAHLRRGDGAWRVEAVGPMPHGHSGFSYLVDAALDGEPRRFVLRLPPPGARPLGPADVVRQGRIMAALGQRGFPVPRVVAMSSDQVVDGRPFVLLDLVPGSRVEDSAAPEDQLVKSAVATLRKLHAIPLDAIGLNEPPVGLAADLDRWRVLLERSSAEPDLPYDDLRRALEASFPSPSTPCLVHADFHFGNLLYDSTGDVVAVLDWEIAEIGQPLIDLSCLAVGGLSRGGAKVGPVPGPSVGPARLAELYGVDRQELDWYCAFSCYKYSAIYAYNRMLHRRGKRIDEFNDRLEPLIERFVDSGLRILRGESRIGSEQIGAGG